MMQLLVLFAVSFVLFSVFESIIRKVSSKRSYSEVAETFCPKCGKQLSIKENPCPFCHNHRL